MKEEECPFFHEHTPHPTGYLQGISWRERMARTHNQEQCEGCGLWVIWVPKKRSPRKAKKRT